jgi:hypothetical protein
MWIMLWFISSWASLLTEECLANFSIHSFLHTLASPKWKIKDVSNVTGNIKVVKGKNNNMQFIKEYMDIFITVLDLIHKCWYFQSCKEHICYKYWGERWKIKVTSSLMLLNLWIYNDYRKLICKVKCIALMVIYNIYAI